MHIKVKRRIHLYQIKRVCQLILFLFLISNSKAEILNHCITLSFLKGSLFQSSHQFSPGIHSLDQSIEVKVLCADGESCSGFIRDQMKDIVNDQQLSKIHISNGPALNFIHGDTREISIKLILKAFIGVDHLILTLKDPAVVEAYQNVSILLKSFEGRAFLSQLLQNDKENENIIQELNNPTLRFAELHLTKEIIKHSDPFLWDSFLHSLSPKQ